MRERGQWAEIDSLLAYRVWAGENGHTPPYLMLPHDIL
jgi:hypothetical protein